MISKPISTKLVVITIYIVCLLMAYLPFHLTIASEADGVIDITSSPSQSIVSGENLAPGDEITGTLEVKNSGNIDFEYTIQALLDDNTDEKLFNALFITITENEEVRYSGVLHNVSNTPFGLLKSDQSSYLDFNVSLPKSAGNELQGLMSEFSVQLTATGEFIEKIGSVPDIAGPSMGGVLPQTGNQFPFLYLIIGAFLIVAGCLFYKSIEIKDF